MEGKSIKDMERKIGEIFEYNGEWYQCVESDNCGECSPFTTECSSGTKSDLAYKVFGKCSKTRRSDNKQVIFKKLEKVGEPYTTSVDKTVQNYLLETAVSVPPKDVFTLINNEQRLIAIKIKQTKEDMEEKKLNLKPFDIQKAKEGKPVCTRDGAKARIICFDAKSDAPIIALITADDGTEITFYYLSDGTFFNTENPDNDLMMLPEKKEGWVNVYKDSVYDTKSEALICRSGNGYIDTIKVEWEE